MCKPPIAYYQGTVVDQDRDEQIETIKNAFNYAPGAKNNSKLSKARIQVPLSELNQRVVVTDYSLAHWIAQTYQIDINDWPR